MPLINWLEILMVLTVGRPPASTSAHWKMCNGMTASGVSGTVGSGANQCEEFGGCFMSTKGTSVAFDVNVLYLV